MLKLCVFMLQQTSSTPSGDDDLPFEARMVRVCRLLIMSLRLKVALCCDTALISRCEACCAAAERSLKAGWQWPASHRAAG